MKVVRKRPRLPTAPEPLNLKAPVACTKPGCRTRRVCKAVNASRAGEAADGTCEQHPLPVLRVELWGVVLELRGAVLHVVAHVVGAAPRQLRGNRRGPWREGGRARAVRRYAAVRAESAVCVCVSPSLSQHNLKACRCSGTMA